MPDGYFEPPVIVTDAGLTDTASGFQYAESPDGVRAICRIPDAFRDDGYSPRYGSKAAFGAAIAVTSGGHYQGGSNTTVFIHRPKSSPKDLANGWVPVNDSTVSVSATNFGCSTNPIMASQRNGEFIFVYTYFQNDVVNGAIMKKINDSGFAQTIYSHTYSPYFVVTGTEQFIAPSANWNLFASDNYPSNLFFLSGNTFCVLDDNGHEMGGIYSSNLIYYGGDNSVDAYGSHYVIDLQYGGLHVKGRVSQTYNVIDMSGGGAPYAQDVIGPTMVWPWQAGEFGEPQLWWYVMERNDKGYLTNRLNVYRSIFKSGAQTLPYSASWNGDRDSNHDPINAVPGLYYEPDISDPAEKYAGWGFDKDWHRSANYVGTVGPFENLYFADPRNLTPLVNDENIQYRNISDIRVVRDASRQNKLHLTLWGSANVPPYSYEGSFSPYVQNNIWIAVSGNDGKTWTRGRHATPAQISEPTSFATGTYRDGFQPAGGFVAESFPGYTLANVLNIRQRLTGEDIDPTVIYHPSMWVIDGLDSGTGVSEDRNPAFKRSKVRLSWV